MPVGDLPGWKQILAENFDRNARADQIAEKYGDSFRAYSDNKAYSAANLSVHDGSFDFTLDAENRKGAAGVFGPPDSVWGMQYGKYSIRFKAVGAVGNNAAIMWWPSSDIWGDGELDYPEGSLGGSIWVHHHEVGCADACYEAEDVNTGVLWTDWHTASTEWTPTSVKYYLDDQLLATFKTNVPTTDHRMTVQAWAKKKKLDSGHLLLDWVTIYSMD